jgi:hypothetical protein
VLKKVLLDFPLEKLNVVVSMARKWLATAYQYPTSKLLDVIYQTTRMNPKLMKPQGL